MSKFTGRITDLDSVRSNTKKRWVTVELEPGSTRPKKGDRVTLTVTRSDEELGALVRAELAIDDDSDGNSYRRDSLGGLADAIESEGWSALADLIRDEI